MPDDSEASHEPRAAGAFCTTHWSIVMLAGQAGTPDAQSALEALCRAYWLPVYAFVRRRGHAPHEAEDLTQGFFERMLAGSYLSAADREKGRFRTFLITMLTRYLANEWDRRQRLKRGGGVRGGASRREASTVAVRFIPRSGRPNGTRRGAKPEPTGGFQSSLRDERTSGAWNRGSKATATLTRPLRGRPKIPFASVPIQTPPIPLSDPDGFGLRFDRIDSTPSLNTFIGQRTRR